MSMLSDSNKRFMLSVVRLNVAMLSHSNKQFMLSVIMLNVVMLSVAMLASILAQLGLTFLRQFLVGV